MIFLILYIIDAMATMYAEHVGLTTLLYATKILLMPLMALYLFSQTKNIAQHKFIYLALIFSWLGDILLMFPRTDTEPDKAKLLFVLGLISFLIAHINYIIHFVKEIKDKPKATLIIEKPYLVLPFIAYAIVMLSVLFPRLASMKFPVTVYTIIILLMVMAAFNRKNLVNPTSFALVFIGAVIFVISDSCIAFNVFYKPFELARFAIMATYTTAQFLSVYGVLKAKNFT